MQSKLIKKGHQMGDILENENISAYYSMKYSDEEVLLLDDAKLLAKPNPLRVEMNTLVLCTRGMAQFVMNGSLHRCPKFAINYNNKTQSHGQYQHSKYYKK